MSRQDKATTERNARILRDLVKQPENKSCADCRKNDARWASWNLGVYLCIRCSGIHRSMGTHISRVKSIDLDIWTPEQMESIQKWGNRLANMYWEKHLKAGHVPPDHKIESFIRSKYESRRWAMEGPQPSDPRVLENGDGPAQAPAQVPRPTPTSTAAPPAPAPLPKTHPLLSRSTAAAKASPAPAPAPAPAPIIDLFGSDEPPALAPAITTAPPAQTTRAAANPPSAEPQPTTGANVPAPTAGSSIFDLDFRAPTPSASSSAKSQTAKADIMSLFSSTSPPPAAPQAGSFFNTTQPTPTVQATSPYASWGGGITSSAPPVQQGATQSAIPGAGGWGNIQMDQGAWGAPSAPQATTATANATSNPWGSTATAVSPSASASADPWSSFSNGAAGEGAGNSSGAGMFGAPAQPAPKKDDRDPFANIWG
ncbi:hypothetical protein CI109_103377 [Kwoniella shandongensis]|uniref:Uncharacterized protein n=1 Tax=Kwoniella shandongensis TaxID=1734106 RepID=A0A5M6BWB2_9TREE|nr:uncharacterized protein CI109_004458 [Kwoniella shandongensis]KAA5527166.1 hypothetical protein CI109_004458 [Kwoniella shandongensis]